ncbi:MAG TPA: NUDIX domain-containing protein [Gemmatimonadales bacterium]|nr:NUDIX domain-containing protein [Gemmatimonadales bacterium]
MPKTSAGLLPYRRRNGVLEVFLVHPGGPFWAKQDDGAWSIPKGEFEAGEDPLTAARREFTEETGFAVDGDFLPLAPIKQPSGKVVYTWIVPGDYDAALVRSNTFTLKGREYPEVDRAAWFDLAQARRKILRGQLGFLDELERLTRGNAAGHGGSGAPDNSRGPSAGDR